MVKRKKVWLALATMLIGLSLYFFPFGYAESFYWLQQNVFGGDYAATTWFFYAWTSAAFIAGIAIMVFIFKRNPRREIRRRMRK